MNLGETVEDDLLIFFRYSNSGVTDAEDQVSRNMAILFNPEDNATTGRKFYRIIGKIEKNLVDLQRVAYPLHYE